MGTSSTATGPCHRRRCWANEAAGIAVKCGPGVAGTAPGDRVIFSFRPHCGRCRYCSSSRAGPCIGHNDSPRWLMHDGAAWVRLNGAPVN
ncbi:MAG: alcohol dehydrogenase catalytic domain-containing protein [Stellaceae bacterium]